MYNPQLDAFVQVADCGSFNKAAEALYLSSTAVIKQINALEKHLDLQLVFRTNHGITLTEAGKVLYKHAKGIMDYSQRAIQEARLAAEAAATTFCVGTSILNPCKPFMDLWYQVSENLPGFKLHIVPFEDDHQGILGEIAYGAQVRIPALLPVEHWEAYAARITELTGGKVAAEHLGETFQAAPMPPR